MTLICFFSHIFFNYLSTWSVTKLFDMLSSVLLIMYPTNIRDCNMASIYISSFRRHFFAIFKDNFLFVFRQLLLKIKNIWFAHSQTDQLCLAYKAWRIKLYNLFLIVHVAFSIYIIELKEYWSRDTFKLEVYCVNGTMWNLEGWDIAFHSWLEEVRIEVCNETATCEPFIQSSSAWEKAARIFIFTFRTWVWFTLFFFTSHQPQ